MITAADRRHSWITRSRKQPFAAFTRILKASLVNLRLCLKIIWRSYLVLVSGDVKNAWFSTRMAPLPAEPSPKIIELAQPAAPKAAGQKPSQKWRDHLFCLVS